MTEHGVENGLAVALAHVGYSWLPADAIRASLDSSFPLLAKDSAADAVSGAFHRWNWGHDLGIDVPQRVAQNGLIDGLKGAGHILITDFPSKAGIPIPFLSKSGLGEFLTGLGIHKGWLNVSLFETGVGLATLADGASDLHAALSGSLEMSGSAFLHTFGEGTIELVLADATQNPILLVSGWENILAGAIATWKTLSVYVAPVIFLQAALRGALVGGLLGYFLSRGNTTAERMSAAQKVGLRSSLVASCFSVKAAFGGAALLGIAALEGGRALGKWQEKSRRHLLHCDVTAFEAMMEAYTGDSGTPGHFWPDAGSAASCNSELPSYVNCLCEAANAPVDLPDLATCQGLDADLRDP